MDVSPLQRKVCASDLPLEQLSDNPNLTDAQKGAEVGRQFEALLLRQILTEAQKPVLGDSGTGQSVSSSVYQDMITNNLADSMSKSGAFGLAHTFEHQLTREIKPAKPHPPA